MEYKNVKYREAESRIVVRGGEVEEMGRYWSKDMKLQLCQRSKSKDLMVQQD